MGIGTEMLISAEEQKPITWDKSKDLYKDKNGTKIARREMCIH